MSMKEQHLTDILNDLRKRSGRLSKNDKMLLEQLRAQRGAQVCPDDTQYVSETCRKPRRVSTGLNVKNYDWLNDMSREYNAKADEARNNIQARIRDAKSPKSVQNAVHVDTLQRVAAFMPDAAVHLMDLIRSGKVKSKTSIMDHLDSYAKNRHGTTFAVMCKRPHILAPILKIVYVALIGSQWHENGKLSHIFTGVEAV